MDSLKKEGDSCTPSLWARVSRFPILADDEAHLWRIPLSVSPASLRTCQVLLSPTENDKACRFYREVDRHRYIVARGSLRRLLGHYCQADPAQLRFRYNSYGKPFLCDDHGSPNLQFNLSHSQDLALIGFTLNRGIGVDIEFNRPKVDFAHIADEFFSVREAQELRALPESARLQAFYRCWSRKEAYIKALGQGMSFPLNQFSVSVAPDAPAQLVHVHSHDQEAGRWEMFDLSPASGYSAAMIVERPPVRARLMHLPEDPFNISGVAAHAR